MAHRDNGKLGPFLRTGEVLDDFDPAELAKGLVDEATEHDISTEDALKIAIDHLREDPDYYTHHERRVRANPLALLAAMTGRAKLAVGISAITLGYLTYRALKAKGDFFMDDSKGQAVADTAIAEWHKTVLQANKQYIGNTYIYGDLGLDWRPGMGPPLNEFDWCGAFAAYCHGVNGLSHEIRLRRMASTYRLYEWAQANPSRIVPTTALVAGDVAILQHTGSTNIRGDHIMVASGPPASGLLPTIEGNAHGVGPAGQRMAGVVTNNRPMDRIILGVRFLPEDYVPE